MGRSAAAEAQVCSPLLRRTPSSADCILPEYIFVSWLPGSPPLLDLFCDPARAFPAPMTALKSRACLLWWVWGLVNAWRFSLSCATEVSGPRPEGWGLFRELVVAACCSPHTENNAFLLPFPPSFIALFIDIFSVGLFRSISS